MTNPNFSNIEDYRDVETITLYHEYIDSNLISQGKMLRYKQAVSRDNARTPMQWDDRENASFTTSTPWIKVNLSYVKINAKEQVSNPDSIFHYYKKLISLRKEHEIIVHGKFVLLLEDNDDIYAFWDFCFMLTRIGLKSFTIYVNISLNEYTKYSIFAS